MKQIDIVKAYTALKELSEFNLPIRKSYEIFSITKKTEDSYQFSVNEEQKLIEKYEGNVRDGGTIRFPDTEKAAGYRREADELANMEVDFELEKVKLSFDDFGEQTISPALLNDLSAVIQFE